MKTYVSVTSVYQIETPHPHQDLAKVMEVAADMHLDVTPMKFQAGARVLEVMSCRTVHDKAHGTAVLAWGLRDRLTAALWNRVAPWTPTGADDPKPVGWEGDYFIKTDVFDWNGEMEHQSKPEDRIVYHGTLIDQLEARASEVAAGRSWVILSGPFVEGMDIDGVMRFAAWMNICFGPRP